MHSIKVRLFAALGLGLGILDTALYLNQLIREPGVVLAQSTSLILFHDNLDAKIIYDHN